MLKKLGSHLQNIIDSFATLAQTTSTGPLSLGLLTSMKVGYTIGKSKDKHDRTWTTRENSGMKKELYGLAKDIKKLSYFKFCYFHIISLEKKPCSAELCTNIKTIVANTYWFASSNVTSTFSITVGAFIESG